MAVNGLREGRSSCLDESVLGDFVMPAIVLRAAVGAGGLVRPKAGGWKLV